MFEVFLSYAREDAAAATRLRDALALHKFHVWQDILELRGGQPWEEQLGVALSRVQVMLALLSPHALDPASYAPVEWRHARLQRTPVIPVRVGPIDALPNDFERLHQYDLSQPDNYAAVLSLVEELKTLRASQYDPVRTELIPLQRSEQFAALQPAFEKLNQWADAQVHPPDVLGGLIELLRHADIADLRKSSAKDFLDGVVGDQARWSAALRRTVVENRDAFDTGLNALRELVRGGRVIPIVLVVMTESEAEELAAGAAFDGSPETLRQEFQALQGEFRPAERAEWPRRYHALPQEWRPFAAAGQPGDTIEQIIRSSFANAPAAATALIPEFWDIRRLSDPGNRRDLKKLRRGCLLIIDAISIRHPKLQRALQQSALDAYPATLVLTVAPHPSPFEVLREVAVFLQLTIGDLEFARRITEEGVAADEAATPFRLEKWLREITTMISPGERPEDDMGGQIFGARR
jgi:hypothetical protein